MSLVVVTIGGGAIGGLASLANAIQAEQVFTQCMADMGYIAGPYDGPSPPPREGYR